MSKYLAGHDWFSKKKPVARANAVCLISSSESEREREIPKAVPTVGVGFHVDLPDEMRMANLKPIFRCAKEMEEYHVDIRR